MAGKRKQRPSKAMRLASQRAQRRALRVKRLQAKLAPRLPGIDPHDLHLILDCMLRRPCDRRVFIRRQDGRYVF